MKYFTLGGGGRSDHFWVSLLKHPGFFMLIDNGFNLLAMDSRIVKNYQK